MKDFAGLIYHCDVLCLQIFPVGMAKQIDWDNSIFSNDAFEFYALRKESQDDRKKPPFMEYAKDDN